MLYKIEGTEKNLKPYLIAAHIDVVPAKLEDGKWSHEPFSAEIENGHIYARGSMDDKANMLGQLEAIRFYLKKFGQPKRTIYLAYGHDEEASGLAGAQEGLGDLAVLLGREEPVAGEADDQGFGEHGGEGVFERAVRVIEIELVERARDVEVRVGVETINERLALVAQVALDFELEVEVGGGGLLRELGAELRALLARLDRAPAEFAIHRGVGEVGDVRHHAGDGEADAGAAVARVIAVEPRGVLHDRLAADLVEGDGLSALARGGGHGEEATGEAGKLNRKEHRRHAAHRTADNGSPFVDPDHLGKKFLGLYLIANRDERKV